MRTTRVALLTSAAAAAVVALGVAAVAAPAVAAPALSVPTLDAAPAMDPAVDGDTWDGAAEVRMTWDVLHRTAAADATTVRIAVTSADIVVRFDAVQHATILAQQQSNDVGSGTDDEVRVNLWPDGSAGFTYQFRATPNGTHYQSSSENTAYAPVWQSRGVVRGGRYTVTMRIPKNALRGGRSATWKLQFVRDVRSTGDRYVWSSSPQQTSEDDVAYAGSATGMASPAAALPKPRVALYGLGTLGSPDRGLTRATGGADISVPITATSSLFATVHPDFSNVEIDQQTIAPSAFARSYTEVRPFFTQSANFFDVFAYQAAPLEAQLYTPAIPTPRSGYAIEGKEGNLSFAGFDAMGESRTDVASAVTYRSPDTHWVVTAQDVAVNLPAANDRVATTGISYNDRKHVNAFVNYGDDSGTAVLDRSQAQRYEAGTYLYTPTFGFAAAVRKIGAYYQPFDGYIQHPDIAGYALYANKIWSMTGPSRVGTVSVSGFLARYHGHDGALDQSDSSLALDLLTRNHVDIQVSTGSDFLLLPSGVFTPITQNLFAVTWHAGTDNMVGMTGYHGASSTPTTISYSTGRFGPGRVVSWVRSSTMRIGQRGSLNLEADDTRDYRDSGSTDVQWLLRGGYTFALGPNSSLSLGVRRIQGTQPIIDVAQPMTPVNAYNLSFAYHARIPHAEVYVAYGDASRLATVPHHRQGRAIFRCR